MVVNILNELINLGLSKYEALAYTGLLSVNDPLSAYEIAKNSQIPSSKIYEVMAKLEERGIVQPVETGSTKKYLPLESSEFIANHRMKTESSLDRLSKELLLLKRDRKSSVIFNLSEYDVLIDKASRMISNAKKEILLSAWSPEFEFLIPLLSKAEKKKVKIAVVHFGETAAKTGQVYVHPIADTIYSEKGGRGLVIVCDFSEAMMGTVHSDGTVDGGVSENSGFVTLAEDYIKHDIYIMKIIDRYDDELKRRFGDNYAMLRDIFSDREAKE
jgi:sugar-specific transcriptional regulator TrmB